MFFKCKDKLEISFQMKNIPQFAFKYSHFIFINGNEIIIGNRKIK
ncbi:MULTISPECIES: hypothetical protein [Bacillus]|nr:MULTISPECIES: hypothetical protein [Bacillus]